MTKTAAKAGLQTETYRAHGATLVISGAKVDEGKLFVTFDTAGRLIRVKHEMPRKWRWLGRSGLKGLVLAWIDRQDEIKTEG